MKTICRYKFSVSIDPQSKARPRMARGGHVYTPSKTQNYEHQIRAAFQDHAPKARPLEGALSLVVDFTMPRPKSLRWKRKPMPRVPHTHVPDLDNLLKAVTDALNHVAWVDDAQIFLISSRKYIAAGDESPQITIVIFEDVE
jgi:Holliday junction resolvase RusA-like endonuclease